MYTSNFFKSGILPVFNKLFASLVILLLSVLFFTSCKITQTPPLLKYTTRDTSINNFVNSDFELKIQKNDVLNVNVSSMNPDDDKVFNAAITVVVKGDETKSAGTGYLVSMDGSIYLHKLGNVLVAGLTRKQLKIKLEKDLQPYFKDPIVTVNFDNHHITLLGAVIRPQVLSVPSEKISIFDVLAVGGSVSEMARLNNVTVIRETEGVKEFKHLNLTDYSIFSSPWYFLQPNDIVVVHQDDVAINQDKKRARNQQAFSIALQAITIAVIVFQNFFK